MDQAKPHYLTMKVTGFGAFEFHLSCPYTLEDRGRPCSLGFEQVGGCRWYEYDGGDHHPDCEDQMACEEAPPEESLQKDFPCWQDRVPEECEGVMAFEGYHIHLVEGCYAEHILGELGWEEGVQWGSTDDGFDLILPTPVAVSCDEDGVTLWRWEDRPSKRRQISLSK